MAKVETFIKVTMEMTLDEARAVRDQLGEAPYGSSTQDAYDALSLALDTVEGVGE